MATYTQLGPSQIGEILALYGLPHVLDWQAMSTGISNSNYAVKTQIGEFILKVSNDKDELEMQEEMQFLERIKQWGFAYSPLPRKTLNGQWIYHYQKMHGALFPRLKGTCPTPSEDVCRQLGQALGELHSLSIPRDKSGLRLFAKLGHPPMEIAYYITRPQCPPDFQQTVNFLFPQGIDKAFAGTWEIGALHGDFYFDNSLFAQGHLSAVLDFEQAGIGACIYDLGIAISGSCLVNGAIQKNLVASYLAGYEKSRPMPAKEKQMANHAIYFGLLSISLWRIKRFMVKNLDPTKKESYKELLHRALHWQAQL